MQKPDHGGKPRLTERLLTILLCITKRQPLVSLWRSGSPFTTRIVESAESLTEKLQRKLWPNTVIETLIMILVLTLVAKLFYGLISFAILQKLL